jgi:hypothetical protein
LRKLKAATPKTQKETASEVWTRYRYKGERSMPLIYRGKKHLIRPMSKFSAVVPEALSKVKSRVIVPDISETIVFRLDALALKKLIAKSAKLRPVAK